MFVTSSGLVFFDADSSIISLPCHTQCYDVMLALFSVATMYLQGKEYFDIRFPDKEEISECPYGNDNMVCVERQGTVL